MYLSNTHRRSVGPTSTLLVMFIMIGVISELNADASQCFSSSVPGVPLRNDVDPTTGLPACWPGFYCPGFNASNSSTYPVYCPPSVQCAVERASGFYCEPQGTHEPTPCPYGYYCPGNGAERVECPKGSYCPMGSVEPRTCPSPSLCSAGSERPRYLLPVILLVIIGVVVGLVVIGYRVWLIPGDFKSDYAAYPGELLKIPDESLGRFLSNASFASSMGNTLNGGSFSNMSFAFNARQLLPKLADSRSPYDGGLRSPSSPSFALSNSNTYTLSADKRRKTISFDQQNEMPNFVSPTLSAGSPSGRSLNGGLPPLSSSMISTSLANMSFGAFGSNMGTSTHGIRSGTDAASKKNEALSLLARGFVVARGKMRPLTIQFDRLHVFAPRQASSKDQKGKDDGGEQEEDEEELPEIEIAPTLPSRLACRRATEPFAGMDTEPFSTSQARRARNQSNSSAAAVASAEAISKIDRNKFTHVLQGVRGELKPGHVTAIMGPSGSGKTVLINTLLGRLPDGWKVTGTLSINRDSSDGIAQKYRPLMGLVPQTDVLYKELTVYQNIFYSAMLRLPENWTNEDKTYFTSAVIENLGLTKQRDMPIGDEETRGVSGGQRRRCLIGTELVAAPLALFLDEPTNGLDSNTALLLVRSLNAIGSEAELTVAMSIHQPRIEIWEELDEVLFLAPGGKTVYQGPRWSAQRYFTKVLKMDFPPELNPADVIIDEIAARGEELVTAWLQFSTLPKYDQEVAVPSAPKKLSMSALKSPPLLPAAIVSSGSSNKRNSEDVGAVSNMGSPFSPSPLVAAAQEPSEGEWGTLRSRLKRRSTIKSTSVLFTSSVTNAAIHRGSFGGGLMGSDEHLATNSNHSQDMAGFGGSLASSGVASPNTDALVMRTNTNVPPPRAGARSSSIPTRRSATSPTKPRDSIHEAMGSENGSRKSSHHDIHSFKFGSAPSTSLGLPPSGPSAPIRRRRRSKKFSPDQIQFRGASFLKQVLLVHNRAVSRQLSDMRLFMVELGVIVLLSVVVGQSIRDYHPKGIVKNYQLITVQPITSFVPQIIMYASMSIGLACGTDGVNVFQADRQLYFREAAAGCNKLAYYLGNVIASLYRLTMAAFVFSTIFHIIPELFLDFGWMFLAHFLLAVNSYAVSHICSFVLAPRMSPLVSAIIVLSLCCLSGFIPYPGIMKKFSFAFWFAQIVADLMYRPQVHIFEDPLREWDWTYDERGMAVGIMVAMAAFYHAVAFTVMIRAGRDQQR